MRFPAPLVAILLAACAAQPPAVSTPDPQAALPPSAASTESSPSIDPPAAAAASPVREDTAWLSDTLAYGTAMLGDGRPAAGADIYVGIAEGIPGEPGDCGTPWGIMGLTRTAPDAQGRWSTRIPRAERGRPGCLVIIAEVRDTTNPTRDQLTAYASAGVDLDSMPVHLTLELLAPVVPPDEPADPRPDWVWPIVARRIPGWAGWINGPGGRCSAIVSLRDMRQRDAARQYVEAELAARRFPGDRPCPRYDITFQQVEYGWADMTRYASRSGILFSFHGVEMYDLDEVANRVVYRFRYAAGARAARRALAVLRVPPGAVQILETEDAEEAGGFGPATPLLGRALATGWRPESPAWSADGREVLFLAADAEDSMRVSIKAVDAVTRRVRHVASTGATFDMSGMRGIVREAADGSLYATLTPSDTSNTLLRIRPGGGAPPRRLRALPRTPFDMDSAGRRFLFTWSPPAPPDGSWPEEVLALWDASTGRQQTVLGPESEWALDPGGRAVVYSTFGECDGNMRLWMYDVQRRTRRVLWTGREDETEAVAAHRWMDGRPRLLLARRPGGAARAELVERDPFSGRETRLGWIPAGGGTRAPAGGVWSPDGRSAALWVTVATDPPGCISGVCDSGGLARFHDRLYLWQAGVEEPRLLAEVVHGVDEGSGWFAFSPDESKIGYQSGGVLYVHDVR